MPWFTVHYKFSQRFPFPVEEAYAWATDYQKYDIGLMGRDGNREVEWINGDTVILNDTFVTKGRTVKKRRLVRLFPELFTLINTRLTGPNKHSQFIYQFVTEGKGRSRLDFTGAHLSRASKTPSRSKIDSLSKEYAKEDGALWVRLATEMKKDLSVRK